MSYFAAGKHADAEKAILKALKLQPQFAQAHMNLGGLYLATERWDEAIPQLQAAVDDPEYREPARARHNLGWAYYNKGSFDEARTQYREVLRGFPRFCPAILNFGMVDEAEGKLQDALVRYKQAADCDPQDLKAPLLAGLVEARLDLVADACEHLGLVAKADPYGELRDQATESLRMLDCAAVTRR
jgi:Tfp pilus assembly protein PilF